MANVHGLFSNKKDEDDEDDSNNRYVGGIGEHGGGSGLAVQPNRNEQEEDNESYEDKQEAIFGLAESTTGNESGEQIRRTITMYRDGFVVDDGPYRRLDDPANGEFLRDLSRGRTPRELAAAESNDSHVVVGLIDKRNEDYVETFTSFSGTGTSLGNRQNASTDGVFSPQSSPSPLPTSIGTITNIAVRLLNGKRQIVQIGLGNTVADLAAHLQNSNNNDDNNSTPFRLMAGFPPRPLTDIQATIEAAGLKGAQISMQKA